MVAGLLRPFQNWPLAGLTVVSILVAGGLLLLFKQTSNQPALVRAKRQIHAGLFELRLFQESPRLMLRASVDLFRQQGRYLRHAFVPFLWAVLPLSLLVAHLQAHYGYEGLVPGTRTIVKVRLKADGARVDPAIRPSLALDAPAGLRVETPCVWTPSLREGAWRIVADRPGDYDLRLRWDGHVITKHVRVSSRVAARSPVRPAEGVWDEWWHPAEAPLPADLAIEAIEVAYPSRSIDVFHLGMPWSVVFLLLTSVFMLLGRSVVGVVI
jgi:hypothetical protein